MSLLECWNSIYEGGDIRVAPPDEPLARQESDRALATAIMRVEEQRRAELAFEPPALVMPVAIWAATRVYRTCQFLTFREVTSQDVRREMATPCPVPPPWRPEVCYSADLALGVLPELLRSARAASPEDPLVESLIVLARDWPLSSVGQQLERADVTPFIDHPALSGLYADRIIARGDVSRLDDPRVRAAVREALGAHADLAPPAIVAALNHDESAR